MENRIEPENKDTNSNKPVGSDTTEIVRRHLEDKNHKITDDEIRNVRIVGEDNEPATTGAEAEAKFENKEGTDSDEEKDLPGPEDKPVTPWDVVA